MNFILDDAGRSNSRRPKQKRDCTVRAVALVTGTAYDTVYDMLAEAGRKCGRGFNFKNMMGKEGKLLGYAYRWEVFQAVKGQRRMNPYSFLESRPQGRFILSTAKHVFAVIDGVIHDLDKPAPDRCVYGCWHFQSQS